MQHEVTYVDKEIHARNKVSYVLLVSILWSGLVCFMAYDLRFQLFSWKPFNPNGFNSILFLLFLIPGIYSWIKAFDRRPLLSITKKGISVRGSRNPFVPLIFVRWEGVYFFYILENSSKITTHSLIVRRKDNEKELKVLLTGLDKSLNDILVIMRNYADKHQFQELSMEFS